MNRSDFRALAASRLLLLDGATGTQLALRGMPPGVCPEAWVLAHPDVLRDVQAAYRAAGSDIVYACTFGGNRFKLEEFHLADRLAEINREIVRIGKDAVGDGLLFGDLAPTGQLIEPFGPCAFQTCVEAYKEQAAALLDGGVDGFVIETMMDIQEARAALLAVREICDRPVLVSITVGEDGRTLTGTPPVAALLTLQALGADAVGLNCSTGPETMCAHIRTMKPYATVPLLAKPNAGQPRLVDGETVFDMGAEEFARHLPAFLEAGVNLMGGCCGTTPAHIHALHTVSGNAPTQPPARASISAVSSAQAFRMLGGDEPLACIGERINPTGKKALQAELRAGKNALVRQYALEQTQAGAALLDVNMGLSGIDEKAMMQETVRLLARLVPTPLCLDSTDPEVMEAGLRLYPGRALVNSVSAERERIERMLPVAAKYGAMLILLPVTDEGIPETLPARQAVTESILAEAARHGYTTADVVVDGLVMTVSAQPEAARVTLDFVEWCARVLGVCTTAGVSNVSFGLPARETINAAFLAMLIGRGLNVPIVNPSLEMMMGMKVATDALLGRDANLQAYVGRYAGETGKAAVEAARDPAERVGACVVAGDERGVVEAIREALAGGADAQGLVKERMIPAIGRVGELFESKTYFLPQLMMSAEAMRVGFAELEPLLVTGGGTEARERVYLATVAGDIHDIGKNLVGLMLRNYGFEVVDLGKDVAAERILEALEGEGDGGVVLGLSALMTTTMVEMRGVVEAIRARQACGELRGVRVMVGGAVVDQAYADGIGADGYAADAIGAVRLARSLLTNHP